MAFTGNSLLNPTILNLPTANVTDSVSTTNLFDTFRFTLTQSSQVNLSLSGLSADANVALIKDTNANNLVDSGEILSSSTNLGSLTELVNQTGLAAGNYFIQVTLDGGTSTSYSLGLTTTSQLQNDIIWRNSTSGDLGLWASNTTATTASYDRTLTLDAPLTPASWVVEGTGDFNGDRVDDLLLRKSDGSTEIRFMNEAGVSSSSAIQYTGSSSVMSSAFTMAGTGDVNGDGKADIFWRNETTQQVVIWMMDGATVMPSGSGAITTGTAPVAASSNYKINAIADFDQDGKVDILWRDANSGQTVYWYLNPGATGATIKSPSSGLGLVVGMNFNLEGVGDFNADGKVDLLWRDTTPTNTGANTIVWLMDGKTYTSAAFATPGNVGMTTFQAIGMRDQGNNKKSAAVLRDWNGDGKADVAWRNIVSGDVVLWRMNGVAIDSGSVINDGVTGAASAFAPARQAVGLARRSLRLDEAGNTTALAVNIGALNGSGNYVGQLSGLDNDDLFKFTLGASTSVNLALTGLTGNADLQLLNSTGGVVTTSALTGTANEYISQTLAAGTYFARAYTTGNIASKYQLTVSDSPIVKLLKDINPGAGSSNPTSFVTIGSTAYFTAEDATNGAELWKTDGTTSGTVLLKDIVAGVAGSDPYNLTIVGTQVFFNAYTAANGVELWRTDGTATGTVLVKDINPGVNSSNPYEMLAVGNLLYFAADNGTNGYELWRSDGTANGTYMVRDIEVGAGNSTPFYLTSLGSKVYFAAKNSTSGYELWGSDGTAAGTTQVKEINSGTSDASPSFLTKIGNTLYFTAVDSTSGAELWKSDGTASGTVLVKDIVAGTGSSTPINLTAVGSSLYFTLAQSRQLWKSDGTAAGTQMVKDFTAASQELSGLLAFGNTLYFYGNTSAEGTELWKSDGTTAGTVLVKDVNPGVKGSEPLFLTPLGSSLYFQAYNPNYGYELWKTDGSAVGTKLVQDINLAGIGSVPNSLTPLGTSLLMAATDQFSGSELWIL